MSDFGFLFDEDQRRLNWLKIADKVIPLITDQRAMQTLKNEQQRFENSKMLNSFRTDGSRQQQQRRAESGQPINSTTGKKNSLLNGRIP